MNGYDAATHAPRRGERLRSPAAENGRHPHRPNSLGPAHERENRLAALGRWFVQQQTLPTLVIDEQMNLLLMNHSVHALLLRTAMFRLVGAAFVWRSASHLAEFNRLVRQRLESVSILVRIDNAVVPAIISRIAGEGESDNDALLLISVRMDVAGGQGDRIREHYGLTPAETEVALAIFSGASLVGIARQRCASLNTVKTQVRAVFRKFRVHSKVDLTRLIGEIMPAE